MASRFQKTEVFSKFDSETFFLKSEIWVYEFVEILKISGTIHHPYMLHIKWIASKWCVIHWILTKWQHFEKVIPRTYEESLIWLCILYTDKLAVVILYVIESWILMDFIEMLWLVCGRDLRLVQWQWHVDWRLVSPYAIAVLFISNVQYRYRIIKYLCK